MPIPKFIKKRDGKITKFEPSKIRIAISKAAHAIHLENPDEATERIYSNLIQKIESYNGEIPKISDIDQKILETGWGILPIRNVKCITDAITGKATDQEYLDSGITDITSGYCGQ